MVSNSQTMKHGEYKQMIVVLWRQEGHPEKGPHNALGSLQSWVVFARSHGGNIAFDKHLSFSSPASG